MPEEKPPKQVKYGIRLALSLLLIGLLWALGIWVVTKGELEWAMIASVAIVFTWIYALVNWMGWVRNRHRA